MMKSICIFLSIFFSFYCQAYDYPDLYGIPNLDHPHLVFKRLFILTNPKSGTHLLLYSLMKATKTPVRGRLAYWHFESDPAAYEPINMMNYPLDFSKPTAYFGHEFHMLAPLNRNQNKLIFIHRNYKENIISCLFYIHRNLPKEELYQKIENIFLHEILSEGTTFKEYITRLYVYDGWNSACRHLIQFKDLVKYPENFLPPLLEFLEDDSKYHDFVDQFDEFKEEIGKKYYALPGYDTGSRSNTKYFANFISKKILQEADRIVKERYPILWDRYLKEFAN